MLLFAPLGSDFAAPEMRLHRVADGHLVIGSAHDGAIVEAGGRLVRETAAFSPFAPQAPQAGDATPASTPAVPTGLPTSMSR